MRALLVSCLASAALLLAGVANANVGDSGNTGPLGMVALDKFGGKAAQAQAAGVQSIFQARPEAGSLASASTSSVANTAAFDAWGLPRGEQASSEAMLLAGGILVIALVIRRISG